MLETAGDGAFVADGTGPDAVVAHASESLVRLMGVDRLEGRPLSQLFGSLPPASGGMARGDVRLPADAGHERWATLVLRPHAPGCWIGVLLECTSSRRAEVTATASDALFRTLMHSARELICVIGRDLRLRFVSDAGAAHLGYDPGSMLGRSALDFVDLADRARAEPRLARLFDGPHRSELNTYRFVHADGSFREYETTASDLLDFAAVPGIVLVCRDVSERELAKLAAAEAAERLQVATQAARVGVFEWDPVTDELIADELTRDLVRQHEGQQWEGMAGFAARLAPADRQSLLDEVRSALQEQRELRALFRIALDDGQHRWIYLYASPRLRPGIGRVRMVGVIQDISHQKRLEHELVEVTRREQQRLGRELHDGLGQDLTGLALMLEAVSQQVRDARPMLAEPMAKLTQLAAGAVQSARAIAHGLAPVNAEHGGLGGALRRLVDRLQGLHGTRLELDWPADRAPVLDEYAAHHLFQIAQEAVNNAMRHARARSVVVRLELTDRRSVQLVVEDDGGGFDEGAAPKLGNGLRSMSGRAESIGGQLAISARPGGGMRVVVTYPGR